MKSNNYSLFIAALTASCLISAGCGNNSDLSEKGEKAFANKDFDKAASLFSEAAATDPSSSALKYNEGVSLAMKGQDAAAATAFEEALKINPDDLDSAEYLAAELEKAGNYDEAHRLMDKVLAGREGDNEAMVRALNTMAKIEFGLNRPDLAIIRLLTARDCASNYAPTFFNLAKLYGETFGLYQKGAEYIEKYLQAAMSEPNERETAEKLLQAYLQIPSRPQTSADVPPQNPDAPFNKGRLSYSKGKYSDAEQHFAKAEKENPNSYYASFFRAHSLLAAKKYKDAEAAYKSASSKATAEGEPVYWTGMAQYAMQDLDKALHTFTAQSIPGWPEDFRSYQTAAEIFIKLGQTEAQKKGNSAAFFYAGLVFARRCVFLAKAQGKSAQNAEVIIKAYSGTDFSSLSLTGTKNPIR